MAAITTNDKKYVVRNWLKEHYDGKMEVVPGSILHTLLILDGAADELDDYNNGDQITDIHLAMYNLVKMAEKGGWNA